MSVGGRRTDWHEPSACRISFWEDRLDLHFDGLCDNPRVSDACLMKKA